MLLGVVDKILIPAISSKICDNNNKNWRHFKALYKIDDANAFWLGEFFFFLK